MGLPIGSDFGWFQACQPGEKAKLGPNVRRRVRSRPRSADLAERPLSDRDVYDNLASELVRGGTVDIEPQDAFIDPLISQMGATIAHEINGGFVDGILADALNTALAVQVTRRFADQSALMLEPSNGLSRERLKRVRDYIEAHWMID